MSVKIRQIHIENFRSIQKVTLSASDLLIIVGKNDSGKSNILRALNLFFNEETNPGKGFDFKYDYNVFAPVKAKSPKEIIVRLELDIPDSYKANNGDFIIWERRWRESGLHSDQYYGIRISPKRRGAVDRIKVEIKGRSNIHALLRQIEFEYVPAVKDASYFDQLRGRIYRTIAEVASKSFVESSSSFEKSIADHLSSLSAEILDSLRIKTRLALPKDLTPIFQRLDFLGGEKSISLDSRGDGIKVRHIPLILKFISEKKRSLQRQGAAPYSFIWAYEEPENNLEFGNAIELAAQFSSFSQNVAQILLTTHSPVFYDLKNTENRNVVCCHVYRENDERGTTVTTQINDLDDRMGTVAILAPRVQDLIRNVREQAEASLRAQELAKQNRPKIFVEGESDKIVLERCVKAFYPDCSSLVDFETKESGGGHEFVIDMLRGWRAHHKHHPQRPRAAGILDLDANEQRKAWNRTEGVISSAKCFCYPKPPHIIPILQAHYRLQITLEHLYDEEIWEWADSQGMLESRTPRELLEIYPEERLVALVQAMTLVPESLEGRKFLSEKSSD